MYMEKAIQPINFPAATKQHVNKWVALSRDYKKVIAVGNTLSEVIEKTPEQERRVIVKVLPALGYAPSSDKMRP